MKSDQPANEGMKQTKPAFFSDCAGFAAELRCSTDLFRPVALVSLAGRHEQRNGQTHHGDAELRQRIPALPTVAVRGHGGSGSLRERQASGGLTDFIPL